MSGVPSDSSSSLGVSEDRRWCGVDGGDGGGDGGGGVGSGGGDGGGSLGVAFGNFQKNRPFWYRHPSLDIFVN